MVTTLSIHHVQITIPPAQEELARQFYTGILQLQEIPKPESLRDRGGLWLCAGELQIHIGVEEGVDRYATKAHVAYLVHDLQEVRRRLESQGIPITESIAIPGYDRFEFRDPFGNRVEVIARM